MKLITDDDILFKLTQFYKVFSDETRLRILMVLSSDKKNVSSIASSLNMTTSSISHQLKHLRLLDLVKIEKAGKEVFYSLKDDHIDSILKFGVEHIYEK